MRKFKKSKKIALLLILFFMMAGGAKAQTSCNNASNITNWNGCNEVLGASNQNTWLKFTADTFAYTIKLYNSNINPKSTIANVVLYSGSCENLVQITSLDLLISDTLIFMLDSLVSQQDYYILIDREDTVSSYFTFCFEKSLKSSDPLCPPPPCELISNGELSSTGTYIAFQYHRVCGWEAAFGHPDIHIDAGNPSAFMWSWKNSIDGYVYTEAISQDIYLDPTVNTYSLTFDWCRFEQMNHNPLPEFNVYLVDNFFTGLYAQNLGFAQNIFTNNASHWIQIAGLTNIPWQSQQPWQTAGPFLFTVPTSNAFTHILVLPIGPVGNSNSQLSINVDNISIIPVPSPILANPQTICLGQTAILTASGGISYTWQPGNMSGNNINVTPSTTTTYTVTGTLAYVCTSSATVTVTVNYPQPDFTYTYVCVENPPTTFNGTATCISGVSNWSWDYGDNSPFGTTQNVTHQYLTGGIYTVVLTITDINGQQYSISHNVIVYQSTKPDLTGYFNTCHGSTQYTVNNYSGGVYENWSYGIVINNIYTNLGTLNTNNFYVNWNSYPNGGLLIVTHTDPHGCIASDSLMVFPCCIYPGSTHIFNDAPITSNISAGSIVTINGIVEINSNISINAAMVYLGPNAKIIVNPTRTLNITNKNTIFQACASTMWDGIYIMDNTATLIITDATIMDAKNAVFSQNGGVFNITGVIFNKNYKHIYVGPRQYAHNGNVKLSIFKCDATILPQYPPVNATQTAIAIDIVQVANITIGAITQLTDVNKFTQADIGISSFNSCVNIFNNKFENFIKGTPNFGQLRGYAIYSKYLVQTPKYSTTYLYVGDQNTSSIFKSNDFVNCTNGIYSYNTEGFVIKYNTFNNSSLATTQKGTAIFMEEPMHPTLTTKQINDNTISNVQTGINLNTMNQATVKRNIISGLLIYSNYQSSGIKMDGGNTNLITCNTISNTSLGAYTYGIRGNISLGTVSCNTITRMQNGIYYTGASSPTALTRNNLYYCTYGIHLSQGGVIGSQGNATYSASNVWSNTGSFDLYTSSNTDGTQSQYYYKGYNPTSGNNTGFPIPKSLALNNAFTMCACTQLMGGLSGTTSNTNQDDMENIVNEEVNFTTFETESKEISKQSVYKELINTDTVNISPDLKTFVQIETAGDLGKIESVAQKAFAGDLVHANQENITISENEKTITAIKQINSILLNATSNYNVNYYNFNNDEFIALQQMAGQCPYEYGIAVFMARAALRSIDTTEYKNECEADQIAINNKSFILGSNSEEQFDLSIYPNPADKELHIDCSKSLQLEIAIYNYTGQLVYSKLLNDMLNKIDLNQFGSGLYTLRVFNDLQQIRAEKITIIK